MIRKQIYTIQEVHSQVRPYIPRQPNLVIYDGDEMDLESQRYAVFKRDKCICIKCQLEAAYYAKEKSKGQENAKRWHFNLYGIKDGKEILFTKDHIVPKSLGGKDHLDNYQTMCSICNHRKRNITNEVYMGINFLPGNKKQVELQKEDAILLLCSQQPAEDQHEFLKSKFMGNIKCDVTCTY